MQLSKGSMSLIQVLHGIEEMMMIMMMMMGELNQSEECTSAAKSKIHWSS
jgi:hypothetical protein